MNIKLSKMQRHNTYRATSVILLDGICIGELETSYSYTRENKLRINSYFIKLEAFSQYKYFNVDGTWESKNAIYTDYGWESVHHTYQTEYKTAKAAKAAAMAFITQSVEANAQ